MHTHRTSDRPSRSHSGSARRRFPVARPSGGQPGNRRARNLFRPNPRQQALPRRSSGAIASAAWRPGSTSPVTGGPPAAETKAAAYPEDVRSGTVHGARRPSPRKHGAADLNLRQHPGGSEYQRSRSESLQPRPRLQNSGQAQTTGATRGNREGPQASNSEPAPRAARPQNSKKRPPAGSECSVRRPTQFPAASRIPHPNQCDHCPNLTLLKSCHHIPNFGSD